MRCSFVLLTYNQEKTVRDAVGGALAQQCEPLEIIISDDCSTDDTFRIAQESVATYSGPHKIVLNRNKNNLGLIPHLQKLSEISSGQYLIAAAGDDVSMPHRSAKIIALFEREAPLLIHSLAKVIDLEGNPASHGYQSATFFQSTEPVKAATSTALYLGATGAWDKALFKNYGAIELEAFEDLVLGFRAALEGRVGFINEELVQYRIGAGITTNSDAATAGDAYRKHWMRIYAAHLAVFRQRRKDASTLYPLPEDPLYKAIDAAALKTEMRRTCVRGEFWRLCAMTLRQPAWMLRELRRERRHQRKTLGRTL